MLYLMKMEGGMKVTRRREGRLKQILCDLKEKKGYWKPKEEADRTVRKLAWEEAVELS
jgi:hypothetical protein